MIYLAAVLVGGGVFAGLLAWIDRDRTPRERAEDAVMGPVIGVSLLADLIDYLDGT